MPVRKALLIALLALSSISLGGCLVEDRGFGHGYERHDDGDRHERFRGYGHDRD
jgi:hypothetical protein